MYDDDQREYIRCKAVQAQKKLLPVRSDKRIHAQEDRQGQRQSQKDNQPEGYFLSEAGSPAGRFGAFGGSDAANEALEPGPVPGRETTLARP